MPLNFQLYIILQMIPTYSAVINVKNPLKKLKEDLRLIYKWLCAHQLSFNVDKIEFILFRPPRRTLEKRFNLALINKTLFESTKLKYLGMILDNSLSWKHHIFELRKKLGRAIGILYKMKKSNCPQCSTLIWAMVFVYMAKL